MCRQGPALAIRQFRLLKFSHAAVSAGVQRKLNRQADVLVRVSVLVMMPMRLRALAIAVDYPES
jgi:hypothetical protein